MVENKAIYERVKVNRKAVRAVMGMVKNTGYYKKCKPEQQMQHLRRLCDYLGAVYRVPVPSVEFGLFPCYMPSLQTILLDKPSIISFLHEYRHHLQCYAGKQYKGLTIEQDARAWSLRIFHLGFPKMFEKAVKEGKVYFVAWDTELGKIVDDAPYI